MQTLIYVCARLILCVQFDGTVALLWVRKGCLKVEEGLEHFKAILTSKQADAKSALYKWTVGTPKKKEKKSQPGAQDGSAVLNTDITWNRLTLNTWRVCESTHSPISVSDRLIYQIVK